MNNHASVNGDDIAKTDVNNSIVEINDELEYNDQVSMANNAIAAKNQDLKDHCFQKLGRAILKFFHRLLVVSLFAGMGGIDHALHQTGCFQTVCANEINDYPARVMEANFPLKVDRRDIRDVLPEGTLALANINSVALPTTQPMHGLFSTSAQRYSSSAKALKNSLPVSVILGNSPFAKR